MLAVCLSILLLPVSALTGSMQRIPATGQPPTARSMHGSAYYSMTLAIFGGIDNANTLLDDL